MKDYKRKFIGPKRIVNLALADRKTFRDNDVYEITYEDTSKEELPKEIIKVVATKKQSDLTELRELWANHIAEQILEVLTESEIPYEQMSYVLRKVGVSLDINRDKALELLWGKTLDKLTLMDFQKVLKQNVQ